MFNLSAAARAIGAELKGEDVQIKHVTTDSRQVLGDDLFVAIKGPRFDGHDFAPQAVADGAIAVMISDELVSKYNLDAGNMVRELAKEIKGGGGGQPFFATAGGKDIDVLKNVVPKAKELIRDVISA